MKKKYEVIIGIVLLLSILLILTEPLIELSGSKEININLNDEYIEPGYVGKTRFKNLTRHVVVNENIYSKKIGTYQVEYQLKYLWNTKKVKRTIHVIDSIKPEIKLKGKKELLMCPNDSYQEEGFDVIDNYDKNLKEKVIIEKKKSKIIYRVKDSSGNEDVKVRTIKSSDHEKPNLILKGENTIILKKGEKYQEPGFYVTDNCEGDITSKVITLGTVNTKKSDHID